MEWIGTPRVLGSSTSVQYRLITASLFGVQFIWSVQQIYVNLALLDLGLSKSQLSLVWVASPLCGLVVQPLVGALSDNSTSSHGRRRPFMIWGAFFSVGGLLIFAWALTLSDMFGIDAWIIAVTGILTVDISLNVCQATSRALITDMFGREQQPDVMAVASVMVSVGHLSAYGLGRLQSIQLGFKTRLQGICIIFSTIFLVCVAISATSAKEQVLIRPIQISNSSRGDIESQRGVDSYDYDVVDGINAPVPDRKRISILHDSIATLKTIVTSMVHLDAQLADIFRVQLFAWYGWFTFLFYGATYAGEVWLASDEYSSGGTLDDLAIAGSYAMLIFSLSSTIVAVGIRFFQPDMKRSWVISLLVYSAAMVCTRFVTKYTSVLIIFAVVGYSWAVAQWVPFSLTSQRIHELPLARDPLWSNSGEDILQVINNNEQLGGIRAEQNNETTEKGGIILGIHNSALTLPQFVSIFGSYLIFRLLEVNPENPHSDGGYAVAATLQVGAFTSFLAAAYACQLKVNPGSMAI